MKETADITTYQSMVDMAKKNAPHFQELVVRSKKELWVGNTAVIKFNRKGISLLKDDKCMRKWFINICSQVKKSANKWLIAHNYNIKEVERMHSDGGQVNDEYWLSIAVKENFWCIDIDSCYWQMAHRLGYISRKLYADYMWLEEFKTTKHLALSFLPRPTHKIYYSNGQQSWRIECDSHQWEIMYSNIVTSSYNLIHKLQELTGRDKVILRRADAIYVKQTELEVIKNYLKQQKIEFKMALCIKTSNSEFSMEGVIKKISPAKRQMVA